MALFFGKIQQITHTQCIKSTPCLLYIKSWIFFTYLDETRLENNIDNVTNPD